VTPVLSVENLTVRYPISGGVDLTAVDDVDLSIEPGKILGLVGESGCGKSSLGRVIAGIQRPQHGRISIDGREMSDRRRGDDARLVQMVFQDPASALNPALTIGAMLRELLLVHSLVTDRKAADRRAVELLQLRLAHANLNGASRTAAVHNRRNAQRHIGDSEVVV